MKSRLENDTKLILNFGYRETQNNLQKWSRNEQFDTNSNELCYYDKHLLFRHYKNFHEYTT